MANSRKDLHQLTNEISVDLTPGQTRNWDQAGVQQHQSLDVKVGRAWGHGLDPTGKFSGCHKQGALPETTRCCKQEVMEMCLQAFTRE